MSIKEILTDMVDKKYKQLSKKIKQNIDTEAAAQIATDYYKDRIEREYNYCQTCSGIDKCQYAAMGNTGFEPDWPNWSPIYSHVKQCRYKVLRNQYNRQKAIYTTSQIPLAFAGITAESIDRQDITEFVNSGKILIIEAAETQLTAALINEAAMTNSDIIYTTARMMFHNLRANNPNSTAVMQTMVNTNTLIIAQMPANINSYCTDEIVNILTERSNAKRTTIITVEDIEAFRQVAKTSPLRFIKSFQKIA